MVMRIIFMVHVHTYLRAQENDVRMDCMTPSPSQNVARIENFHKKYEIASQIKNN